MDNFDSCCFTASTTDTLNDTIVKHRSSRKRKSIIYNKADVETLIPVISRLFEYKKSCDSFIFEITKNYLNLQYLENKIIHFIKSNFETNEDILNELKDVSNTLFWNTFISFNDWKSMKTSTANVVQAHFHLFRKQVDQDTTNNNIMDMNDNIALELERINSFTDKHDNNTCEKLLKYKMFLEGNNDVNCTDIIGLPAFFNYYAGNSTIKKKIQLTYFEQDLTNPEFMRLVSKVPAKLAYNKVNLEQFNQSCLCLEMQQILKYIQCKYILLHKDNLFETVITEENEIDVEYIEDIFNEIINELSVMFGEIVTKSTSLYLAEVKYAISASYAQVMSLNNNPVLGIEDNII
jgi:hypothetical protein